MSGDPSGEKRRSAQRARMCGVLALCCIAVAVSVGFALVLVRSGRGLPASWNGGDNASQADVPDDGAALLGVDDYEIANSGIDAERYPDTVLPRTRDAGQAYVDSTLFLGDSNTVRMYRMYTYCTAENAIGSVGMAARSLATFACVGFAGYPYFVTMPQAVALLQPERVIITFGTNDLASGTSTQDFIDDYQNGIQAVQDAYPSVDIIVNSIPPLGRSFGGEDPAQDVVDKFNRGIVDMCSRNGWKFLNSAEALKDGETGYAKDGYTETSDGVHLTESAMKVLFAYIRTHSYITKDDRPLLTEIPERSEDLDVVAMYALQNTPYPGFDADGDPEQMAGEERNGVGEPGTVPSQKAENETAGG